MRLNHCFLKTVPSLSLLLACALACQAGCADEPHHASSAPPAAASGADDRIPAAAHDDASAPASSLDAARGLPATAPDTKAGQISSPDPLAPLADSAAGRASPSDAGQASASPATAASPAPAVSPAADVDAGGVVAADSIAQAYAALTRGDPSTIDATLEALDRALAARPDGGFENFYAGTFRIWKLSEGSLGLGDILRTPNLADETLDRLGRARMLMPDDFRVPGFLGLAQVNAGNLSSDDAMLQKGLATLDQAIAQFPAYGHYLRAMSTSGLAKDSALFRGAVDDMAALTKACVLTESDGEVAYVYPSGPTAAPSPHVCLNDGIVPHVWEGIFITFGDLALKSGASPARVRALYRSAQTSPTYASWPFAKLLEQRLARVDSDVKLYADDNPLNDPEIWATEGHICTGCHKAR